MNNLLTNFRISVLEKNLSVYAVSVFQKDRIIGSHYFRCDDRINLFSGSKTFSAIGIGIAEDENLLSVEDKVLEFFPEFKNIAVPNAEKITIKNLLNMCSGHCSYGFRADETTHNKKNDWAELFFKEPIITEPGSEFFYENTCTYMLGRIIEVVTGLTMRDYLIPKLFEPLGIPNPSWHTCPKGHTLCAIGLYLKNQEFGKIGTLMLQKGLFKEKQLVSKNYVDRAINDIVTTKWNDSESNKGYGYQLWRCSLENSFRADGKYGQFSIVIPSYDSVITITSHNEQNANDILRTVWTDILPNL